MQVRINVRRIFSALVSVCVLLAARPSIVAAQARGTASPTGVAQGQATYRLYCASCHGDQGKGNGPAASALKARPTDLTTLAKVKGSFPAAAVETSIKGITGTQLAEHEPVPAHGSYAMPVWGPYFLATASSASEAELRVTNLVKFIESIQAR